MTEGQVLNTLLETYILTWLNDFATVTGILGPVPLVVILEVISEAIKERTGRSWSALIAHSYMLLPSP
jgi:hypothetical protein